MADNMYKGNADPAGENRGLLGGRAGAGSVQEQVGLACTDGGLFGCFSDIPVCLTGWCCPCFLFGQSLKRTKQTGSTCAGCMIYMVPGLLVSLAAFVFFGSLVTDPAFLTFVDPRCYCAPKCDCPAAAAAAANSANILGNVTAGDLTATFQLNDEWMRGGPVPSYGYDYGVSAGRRVQEVAQDPAVEACECPPGSVTTDGLSSATAFFDNNNGNSYTGGSSYTSYGGGHNISPTVSPTISGWGRRM
eukprot:SAG22_NODE_868_length_6763_cov_110.776261_4_plen_245_part_01